jgi:hypothetical protein
MSLRLIKFGVAAVVLAVIALSLGGNSARAFTMETLGSGGSGDSRFADPGSPTVGRGLQLLGPGGPMLQFGGQTGTQLGPQFSPFSHYPGAGFAPSQPTPRPYDLNNLNN